MNGGIRLEKMNESSAMSGGGVLRDTLGDAPLVRLEGARLLSPLFQGGRM